MAAWIGPASADAQEGVQPTYAVMTIDAETQADFDRAAAYWNNATECPTIRIFVDQAFVAPYAAVSNVGGCWMWVGDYFLAASNAVRCQVITHEWGHLTGHGDEAGLPDDPSGVMASDTMSPQCAALRPPPEVTAAPPTPPAADPGAAARDAAYVKWAERRNARAACTATAGQKRHRPARVAARQRCVRRYGRIWRAPL